MHLPLLLCLSQDYADYRRPSYAYAYMYLVPIFLRKILVTSVQWLCPILEHSWSEKNTQPVDWLSSAFHLWLAKLANFPISYIIKANYIKTWLLSDESDYTYPQKVVRTDAATHAVPARKMSTQGKTGRKKVLKIKDFMKFL